MLCNNRISLISKVTVLDVSFRAGEGRLSFPFLYGLHQRELTSTLQTETVEASAACYADYGGLVEGVGASLVKDGQGKT